MELYLNMEKELFTFLDNCFIGFCKLRPMKVMNIFMMLSLIFFKVLLIGRVQNIKLDFHFSLEKDPLTVTLSSTY